MKKRILLIAPSCYPINGAESIVNIKMLKALTKSGNFIIDLVTKKNKWEDYPTSSLEELDIEINQLKIIEVDNTVNLRTVWGHVLSLLYFGVVFKGSHWASKALPVVKKLVKKNKYDYILTKDSAAPLIGYYIKKHYGMKWVATWNDPYPLFTYPEIYAEFYGAKRNYFSDRMLQIMNKYVDKHIFPSDRLSRHMNKYIGFKPSDSIIIPHVVNISETVRENRPNDDILRMIHSGNLKYPRDPEVFLKGLRRFLDKERKAKIEITILGVSDDSLEDCVNKYKLKDIVKFHSPVSYMESLKLLSSYDIAIIIEAQCPEGIFMPTKVSDFMQVEIPIFAVSPASGVLHDLYEKGNINYFTNNSNPEDVASELFRIYEDFRNKSIGKNSLPENFTERFVEEKYYNM